MSVDVNDLLNLGAEFDNHARQVADRVERVLDKTAQDIVGTAQRLVPIDTTATQQSIHASKVGEFGREVGPTTHYAPYLEFGTSKMAPYAFMGPALDRHTPGFVDAINEATETL